MTLPRFDLPEFLSVIQDYRITRAWVVPPIVVPIGIALIVALCAAFRVLS